jgi:prepilin signal peptidase PulO-like enzyme (type II secretory pathway)
MIHLCIIILLTMMGMGAGSFATTALYRLPRGELWLGERPNCNLCSHTLVLRDFMPIFSYFARAGRCRYCGSEYKMELPYFLTELFITLIFVGNYLLLGLTETYLLLTLLETIALVALIADSIYGSMHGKLLLALLYVASAYRIYQDHAIFPLIDSAVILAFAALFVRYGYFSWRNQAAQALDFLQFSKENRFVGPYFDKVKLAVCLGIWVGTLPALSILAGSLLIAAMLYFITKKPLALGTISLLLTAVWVALGVQNTLL